MVGRLGLLGEQVGGAGQAQATFGYQGELTVAGQVDLRARTYDPTTGRFMSVDPLGGTPGDVLAANPYPYAANDPLDQSDPTGLHPISQSDFNFGLWNAWNWDHGYGWYGYSGPSYGYPYSVRYVGARYYGAVAISSGPRGLLCPTEAMIRAAIAVGAQLGRVMVEAKKYATDGVAFGLAQQACINDPNAPGAPGPNNPCGIQGEYQHALNLDSMAMQADSSNLAGAVLKLGFLTGAIKAKGLSGWDILGLVAGAVAVAATGGALGAALAGSEILAGELGTVAIAAGLVATGIDAAHCFATGSGAACAAFGLGVASLFTAGAGMYLDAAASTQEGIASAAGAAVETAAEGMSMTSLLGHLGALTGALIGLDALVVDTAEAYVERH